MGKQNLKIHRIFSKNMFSITFLGTQSIEWKYFSEHFQKHKIFSLKKIFLHAFHPTKHSFMFTKKSILAIVKYWRVAPYLISFKWWTAPFIECKSRFVKGAFPLRSNDNDKGPLIDDQINWKSSFHIVAVAVSRTKSLFLHIVFEKCDIPFFYKSSAQNETCEISS